jgi:hypothetical protein
MLFRKYSINGICFHTPVKLTKVGLLGKNTGGYAKMFSSAPFKAVERSHKKGNMDKSETDINVKCIKNPFKFFIKTPLKSNYS